MIDVIINSYYDDVKKSVIGGYKKAGIINYPPELQISDIPEIEPQYLLDIASPLEDDNEVLMIDDADRDV